MTAQTMLAEMRRHLGLGEPNFVQDWYRRRNGNDYAGNVPWCDELITYSAFTSENYAAVCPRGDRAYTVAHASDFQALGRWHSGTTAEVSAAKPGDIVFFDWDGTNTISAIDHVGIVEVVLGNGRVQTIEGNTSDQCLRRVRDSSTIAGYGRPAYAGAPSTPPGKPPATSAPAWPGRYLRQPPVMTGSDVRKWQTQMQHRGWHLAADGAYGPASATVCRGFQSEKGLEVDGVVGPATWRAAWTEPIT